MKPTKAGADGAAKKGVLQNHDFAAPPFHRDLRDICRFCRQKQF